MTGQFPPNYVETLLTELEILLGRRGDGTARALTNRELEVVATATGNYLSSTSTFATALGEQGLTTTSDLQTFAEVQQQARDLLEQALQVDYLAAEIAATAAQAAADAAALSETASEDAQALAETARTDAEIALAAAEASNANAIALTDQAASNADAARILAETAASVAQTSETTAATHANNAGQSATAAASSETIAAAHATDAQQQAAVATTARVEAETAASNASVSETNAATSETNAAGSAASASTSASLAATSETNAGDSATAAATSATVAESHATDAGTSATAAQASRLAAETAQSNAETAEFNAATSETNAAGSAASATTSASQAATSESNAGDSATAAANSATVSQSEATDAAQSATTAQTAQLAAETAQSNAETSETNAATSETNAAGSAASASSSETNAATSENNAGDSATAAATSASLADTRATAAGTFADAAEADRIAAQTARAGAETAESNAASSETSAAGSAATASTAASQAANSETQAGNSATAAANSASVAATEATDAAQSASSASVSANEAATSAGDALVSQQAAATSEQDAANHQAQAFQSETAAANSETAAAGSAQAAATSESAAATSASEAGANSAEAAQNASISVRSQRQATSGNLIENGDSAFDWSTQPSFTLSSSAPAGSTLERRDDEATPYIRFTDSGTDGYVVIRQTVNQRLTPVPTLPAGPLTVRFSYEVRFNAASIQSGQTHSRGVLRNTSGQFWLSSDLDTTPFDGVAPDTWILVEGEATTTTDGTPFNYFNVELRLRAVAGQVVDVRNIHVSNVTDAARAEDAAAEAEVLEFQAAQSAVDADNSASIAVTNATLATNAQTAAEGAAQDAENAATDATTSAAAAGVSETNAALSETNAQSAEAGAVAAQTLSSTAQISAETAATDATLQTAVNLPSTFEQDGLYFANGVNARDDDLTVNRLEDIAAFSFHDVDGARVLRFTNNAAGNEVKNVTTRATFPLVTGNTYRLRISAKYDPVGAANPNASILAYFRSFDVGVVNQVSYDADLVGSRFLTFASTGVWEDLEILAVYTGPTGKVGRLMGQFRGERMAPNDTVDVRSFKVEDITALVQAEDAAADAALSEANAAVSETQAALSEANADGSAQAAAFSQTTTEAYLATAEIAAGNWDFRLGLDNWHPVDHFDGATGTPDGSTVLTGNEYSGGKAVQFTANEQVYYGSLIPINQDGTYRVRARVKNNGTVASTFWAGVRPFQSDETRSTINLGAWPVKESIPADNQWYVVEGYITGHVAADVDDQFPDDAAFVTPMFIANLSAGDSIIVDEVRFEEASLRAATNFIQSAISSDDGASATAFLGVEAGPVSGSLSLTATYEDGSGDATLYIDGANVVIDGDTILNGSLTLPLFGNGELQTALYPLDIEVIDTSGTWTPRRDGLAQVYVIGGGGSGGACTGDGYNNPPGFNATGGGAGGTCVGFIPDASTAQSYTATIGAGGAGVSVTTTNTGAQTVQSAGNAGGTTSLVGHGVNFQATGGGAGNANQVPAGSSTVIAGAIGGVGSGGTLNLTGGGSGTANRQGYVTAGRSGGTGGGAVNLAQFGASLTSAPAVHAGAQSTTGASPFNAVMATTEVSGIPFKGVAYFGGSAGSGGFHAGGGPYTGSLANMTGYGGGSGGIGLARTDNEGGPTTAISGNAAQGCIIVIYYGQGNLI